MKSTKILTLIATIFFVLAAISSLRSIPQFRNIIRANNGGSGNTMFIVPIVETILALGSLLFWLYIFSQEKKGLPVAQAKTISIALIVLSILIPWALMSWLILMPIYNLG